MPDRLILDDLFATEPSPEHRERTVERWRQIRRAPGQGEVTLLAGEMLSTTLARTEIALHRLDAEHGPLVATGRAVIEVGTGPEGFPTRTIMIDGAPAWRLWWERTGEYRWEVREELTTTADRDA